MKTIINRIVSDDILHAKWLNTLSFMENAGARKISACENRFMTNLMQLKHAAEEHRHAYYLKKQLSKLDITGFQYYSPNTLLAANHTLHYLHALDIQVCRYLKNHFQLDSNALKYAAYLFVTYAIEVRADELYPIYQEALTKHLSKVMVKSIILEEEGHLEEMVASLKEFDERWEMHATAVLALEKELFEHWFSAIALEIEKAYGHIGEVAN